MSAAKAAPARRAFVGLGANLDDPGRRIAEAVASLAALPTTRLVAVSSLYRSAPVEAGGPDYLNAVAELSTALPPAALLASLQEIEAGHGRERPYRNAPRTLDLDLLLYAGEVVDTPTLTLPHPRMHARAFVLMPLAEIDATLAIPGRPPLAQLLAACSDQRIERVADAGWLLAQGPHAAAASRRAAERRAP